MFGDPVKNEKGWEVKELHFVCKHIFGGGTPSKSKPEYYIGNIPWVTPKDMKSDIISDAIDHINEEAVINSSTKLVPQNSVLMVIRSGILKHTLPVAINDKIVAMNQDMKAFVPNTDLTNAIFLKYFFHRVASFLLSKVRAVTADNIEFEQIKNMQFICPPIKLQNDFSICISNIQKQFETNLDHNKKTASLFNSLIQKAFNGELIK
jgi:type I restriction enzyme S subunit